MFGRKSNQIKALKQELSIKDRTLADRHQLLAVRNGDLETLKSENQALKARVEELESGLQEQLKASAAIPNEAPQ